MLQNWFIALPELFFIGFFIVSFLVKIIRHDNTAKTFFSLSQFFLFAIIISSIVFYNKSSFPQLWQNTPFSTLFKTFVYLLSWAWFYLSSKWFLNKNRSSYKYYNICFAELFCFNFLASSSSILTLDIIIPLIFYLNYQLILIHWDFDKVNKLSKAYALSSLIFVALLLLGSFTLYHTTNSFSYADISKYFALKSTHTSYIIGAVFLIISVNLYLLSLVPFHNWFISFISLGVLPVCGFISIVPPLIYLCSFISLMNNCFSSFIGVATPFILTSAIASMLIGSISANHEKDIRRLFAFIFVYSIGFTIIGLLPFSKASVISSFAYMLITILSFAGIYNIFLGLKSKSEYLSQLTSLNGICTIRPYMSVAILLFMFSLIGLAPTLGFFGYLSVLNNLVVSNSWGILLIVLISLLFVVGACIQVIRSIYFTPLSQSYDRVDKAIYICLFINTVIIMISIINPEWIIHDALVILGGMS